MTDTTTKPDDLEVLKLAAARVTERGLNALPPSTRRGLAATRGSIYLHITITPDFAVALYFSPSDANVPPFVLATLAGDEPPERGRAR